MSNPSPSSGGSKNLIIGLIGLLGAGGALYAGNRYFSKRSASQESSVSGSSGDKDYHLHLLQGTIMDLKSKGVYPDTDQESGEVKTYPKPDGTIYINFTVPSTTTATAKPLPKGLGIEYNGTTVKQVTLSKEALACLKEIEESTSAAAYDVSKCFKPGSPGPGGALVPMARTLGEAAATHDNPITLADIIKELFDGTNTRRAVSFTTEGHAHSGGTINAEDITKVVCYVPGTGKAPPQKEEPPAKPDCYKVKWMVHPAPPNNYQLALDAYNTKLAGKSVNVAGATKIPDIVGRVMGDNDVASYASQKIDAIREAYAQLPAGHMVSGDVLSEDAKTIAQYKHELPTLVGVQAKIRAMVTAAFTKKFNIHNNQFYSLDTVIEEGKVVSGTLIETVTLRSPNVDYKWNLRQAWEEYRAPAVCPDQDAAAPKRDALLCPGGTSDCREDKSTDRILYK